MIYRNYLQFVVPELGLGEASGATLACPAKGAATGACCMSNASETKYNAGDIDHFNFFQTPKKMTPPS